MQTEWQINEYIPDPNTGKNRWQIYKVLKGGMGVIYIVFDTEWREVFAVKTYQNKLNSAETREKFKKEALIWINIDRHENIAWARFVEKIYNRIFLFFEYVSGGDLSRWIGTKKLNLKQSLIFAIQFCNGMEHVILQGIRAHRDIKPKNCLITENGILKITDFGLSKAYNIDDLVKNENQIENLNNLITTKAGQIGGTLPYMAPEQFEDLKNVDVKADIYSFGVMLFEMFSGHLPFQGHCFNEFRQMHQKAPIPKILSDHNLNIEPLDKIVQKCLAKNPDNRYIDFTQLKIELSEIFRNIFKEEIPGPRHTISINLGDNFNKGTSLLKLDRNSEALYYFDDVLQSEPKLASAWCHKGIALGNMGQHEKAIYCYDIALAIDPDFAVALLNKGLEFQRIGHYEESISYYTRAHEADPALAMAHCNKGSVFAKQLRIEEALNSLDLALVIDRNCLDAWYNIGNILAKTGKFDMANECFDRVLRIDLNYEKAWSAKGAALFLTGKYDSAISCCDEALNINSKSIEAWCNKGNALGKIGKHDEAILCYDNAINIEKNNEVVWCNKGLSCVNLGQSSEALECFNLAITIKSDYEKAWYNKGILLLSVGQVLEALKCLNVSKNLGNNQAEQPIEYCKQLIIKSHK